MTARSSKILSLLLVLCVVCLAAAGGARAEEPAAEAAPAGDTAQPAETQEGQGEAGNGEAEGAREGMPEGAGEAPAGGMPSGGFPGGGGGGMPSGGGRGGGKGGESSGITPGKALSSAHASGKKDMTRYGSVELTAEAEGMQALTLGGEELALTCGGSLFTVSVEEDVLVLCSEEGDAWSLTMDVLKTLKLSGIRQLRLAGPGTETVLDTDLELTGSLYGKERTKGFVSADFLLMLRDGKWMIRVDGREYRLSGNELIFEERS